MKFEIGDKITFVPTWSLRHFSGENGIKMEDSTRHATTKIITSISKKNSLIFDDCSEGVITEYPFMNFYSNGNTVIESNNATIISVSRS